MELSNNTLRLIKEIKDEKFEKPFIFDCFYATMLLLLTMVVSLITWSLIKLINNRDQRNIDRIIKWQTYILYFSGVYLTGYFFSGTVLPLPLKEYIGLVGCDITDLIMNFNVGFLQSQSFFMALYRYLCIIHCDFFDGIGISGKVSKEIIHTEILKYRLLISQALADILLVGEVLFSIAYSVLFSLPRYPEGNSRINNCKGRNEVFFDYDYFVPGGISRGSDEYCIIENPFGKHVCEAYIVIAIVICSNFCEIFFLGRIVMFMKNQTISVKEFLTKSVFEERRR